MQISLLSILIQLLHLATLFRVKLHSWSPADQSYFLCLLFLLIFPIFHRQARALCCASRRFFKNMSGQLIHVTEDLKPHSQILFILNRDKFIALRALAEETLLKTEVTAPLTYSAENGEEINTDIFALTTNIRITLPLVLITFSRSPALTVDT